MPAWTWTDDVGDGSPGWTGPGGTIAHPELAGGGDPPVSTRFPGDPKALGTDKVLWGTSRKGNGDPGAKFETPTGLPLAIRRTFFNALSDISVPNGAFFQMVRADHTAGRLPLISFKVSDWADAAAGGWDTEFDALIAELESYAKPTWVIINHEPENDGGSTTATNWRGMQARFRARMDAFGTINRITFASCLMAYTWNPSSGRDPEDWWVPDCWDVYTVDHYTEPDQNVLRSNFLDFVSWAEDKGTAFGIGEWGLRNDSEDPDNAAQMQGFFDYSAGRDDFVSYCYFDSDLNSTGSGWELREGDDHTALFRSLMGDARAVDLADLGY